LLELGRLLKENRLKNNLSLETLSKMTDTSASTLSNLENGKIQNPSNVLLYRLSKFLNVDYNYILRERWGILPSFSFYRNRL